MTVIKKILLWLRDWVEIYIPITSFIIMFVVFVLQILFRYVFRNPLQWAYEITVTCYLWMVLLGACYAQRTNSHVVFSLIYDKLPLRWKALFSLLGNGLIVFAFVYSFIPNIKFIDFMKMQVTSTFKIGLNIVYLPFIPFMIMMILYAGCEIIREFRIVANIATPSEIEMMLQSKSSEIQEAIKGAHKEEEA